MERRSEERYLRKKKVRFMQLRVTDDKDRGEISKKTESKFIRTKDHDFNTI